MVIKVYKAKKALPFFMKGECLLILDVHLILESDIEHMEPNLQDYPITHKSNKSLP